MNWRFTHSDTVRFGDLDAMRHLNNVAFLTFFESARIAYIGGLIPAHNPADPDDFGLIFAECHIRYRSPGQYGERIDTHLRPAQVQRSAFRIEFEMRVGERLLADGYGVLVGYDYSAARSAPLPDSLRELLEAEAAA
ncbi:MAG: thioesterase family protein [Solirubrobacteraceae bacterium]